MILGDYILGSGKAIAHQTHYPNESMTILYLDYVSNSIVMILAENLIVFQYRAYEKML